MKMKHYAEILAVRLIVLSVNQNQITKIVEKKVLKVLKDLKYLKERKWFGPKPMKVKSFYLHTFEHVSFFSHL